MRTRSTSSPTLVVLHSALVAVAATILLLAPAAPARAQLASGGLTGRIADVQGMPIPGVALEARNVDTGFVRQDTSDASGVYRLPALPVGDYVVSAQLAGFSRYEQRVTVSVGVTRPLDIALRIAPVNETVSVTAATPLISTRSSSVGEVVDLDRIEGLPLNGRQFANLAATVPGVGLGFFSDVSKSAQYSPQISGGNGRNINYLVDGGDNTDDTVGGLLQQYPLESIREFNLLTQRFDAEYGRSNGGVLSVVTKSGTNVVHGSGFTLFRDDALNAETTSERLTKAGKQPYRRYQYGGSLGGPVVLDRVHYFAAFERTQQDTKQAVDTLGLYPDQDGVFSVPYRQNLFDTKVTMTPSAAHYIAVRYAYDDDSQPTGAGLRAAHSSWATAANTFHSVNVNHNWQIGGRVLNEAVVQYSHYLNDTTTTGSSGPSLIFPNGVSAGTNVIAPSQTEQTKVQLRDDVSWSKSGLGLSHELRAGVNLVHEPRLFAYTGQGTNGIFFMLTPDPNGPVMQALRIGGTVSTNIPLDLFGTYVQDDWRATDRLTFNLGVRWDYVSGMPIDQSQSPNFQAMQAAGASGRFAGTVFQDFGQSQQGDTNNVQPRLGVAYDVRGNGKDVLRGGWGIYTDLGYTNSNALTASFDASGGAGIVFAASSTAGLRKPDGTFFHTTDPLTSIASLNAIAPGSRPSAGEVVSPRLQEPFTYQTNAGWSHELDSTTAVSADYVRVQGRNLNMRIRPNVVVNGQRYFAGVGVQPNDNTFRVALSAGSSEYDAMILGVRRRLSRGLDLDASYTLAKATSDVGTAYDELAQSYIQDVTNPFGPVQQGPSARTDARHLVTISAIVEAPWQVRIAPVFSYHSALPIETIDGTDLNHDGQTNDITAKAYRYTGLDANGVATFVEDGTCATVNCSRRAPFSQLNLRVSRSFRLVANARVEAIGEVFNLFNAQNPFLPLSTNLSRGGKPLSSFMQPAAYAGDVGQPEQRIGQLGFRVTW
ncbi:MAG TPA: TonB-dependent receptor [Vicinamibacterales bacterium]|nr:TonB-dependent receptor [Vicinamibacterales bacterium]